MQIKVVEKILSANEAAAADNRALFEKNGVAVVNMMSSPGSGKTSLVERLAGLAAGKCAVAVVVGDVATVSDAQRIAKHDIPVVQIETGGACHLDASTVNEACLSLDLPSVDVLIIENVGNLVCPAAFDLGENKRVVVASVPEGDDKVEKYPHMFQSADLVILNKVDLLDAAGFDLDKFRSQLDDVNPDCPLLQTSCTTGEGTEAWADWVMSLSDKC